MTLKKFQLINYTSHKDTVIEFGEHITSIVGQSEQGKSNLFHGLRTVCFAENWPVTDIRDGQTYAELRVWRKDGCSVRDRRTADGGRTISFLDASNKLIGDKYTGNKGMREKVEEFLGIRKVQIDPAALPEDINFIQVDDDLPITGQPETVKRRIINVIGGSKLEFVRSEISHELKSLNKTESALQNELSAAESKLQSMETLIEQREELYNAYEEHNNQLTAVRERLDLMNTCSGYVRRQRTNSTCTTVSELKKLLEECEENLIAYEEQDKQHTERIELSMRLLALSTQAVNNRTQIEAARAELSTLLDKVRVCDACGSVLDEDQQSS